MTTEAQQQWSTGKDTRKIMPSDRFALRPYRCECGATAMLSLGDPLPRDWRVELVKAWRRGAQVFCSWRYECPDCRAGR